MPTDMQSPNRNAGLLVCLLLLFFAAEVGARAAGLTMVWTNNMLTVRGPDLPGGTLVIWYLEAFCRSGSTHRDWNKTTVPHRTRLLSSDANGKEIRLVTTVQPNVEVTHEIRAGRDELDFRVVATNHGAEFADVDWFQPCMRVDRFMGRKQEDYWRRCFIFTKDGLKTMDQTRRAEDALYRGGQVYVPKGINLNDVNPRPLSPERPVNGLIGCFSQDDRYLLAMAWDQTQELFQGVIVCIHNDPHLGGLKPGQTKQLHGKVYFLKNDPKALLERYRRDFGK